MPESTETARFISRKFILTAVVILEAGAFAYLKVIDPATWAALTGAALAAYCTSNVAQKAVA